MNVLFLELNAQLENWNKLFINQTAKADENRARALREELTYKSSRYQVDLIEALETGPPRRRQIAALALGFSEPRDFPSDKGEPTRAHRVPPEGPLVAASTTPCPTWSATRRSPSAQSQRHDPHAPPAGTALHFEHAKIRINAAWALNQLTKAGADVTESIHRAARPV
ncbi:MAG: hypothetical protein R3F17_06875 [Planctomycetota bacterium]